jgi:YfiH family protein
VRLPVSWANQVHGDGVLVTSRERTHKGTDGDALVTTDEGLALAVFTADCAPVAMASPEGVVAAAHGGWTGLTAGVLERAAEAMRVLGAGRIEAALGPCIRPECYEFGPAELERVVQRFGEAVRGETSWGAPALDLPAAVQAALESADVELVYDHGTCTACDPDGYYSHRARCEPQRQAMFVWKGSWKA